MKVNEPIIEVSQQFQTPIEMVWEAITNVTEMRQWFFDNIPNFEASVGFETQFNVTTENRVFPHVWKITDVVPLKKIVYNWSYEGYLGNSIVTFYLSEIENQTLLTLTTKVTEDFPDNIPEFKRESCLDGWNYFIKNKLSEHLKEMNKT